MFALVWLANNLACKFSTLLVLGFLEAVGSLASTLVRTPVGAAAGTLGGSPASAAVGTPA